MASVKRLHVVRSTRGMYLRGPEGHVVTIRDDSRAPLCFAPEVVPYQRSFVLFQTIVEPDTGCSCAGSSRVIRLVTRRPGHNRL